MSNFFSNKRSFEKLDFSTLFQQNKSIRYSTDSKEKINNDANGLYRVMPDASGWVVRPEHHDMMDFAIDNLPSTWSPHAVAWICLKNHPTYNKLTYNVNGGSYSGKWMWYLYENALDEKFLLLADALQNNLLGDSIKVQPTDCQQYVFNGSIENGSHPRPSTVPFIVYTKDFRDREDVLRVGLALRKLGANLISYKPDIFTLSADGIHGSNQIPKSIYTLRKDSAVLTLTDKGRAYDIAVQMVTGERGGVEWSAVPPSVRAGNNNNNNNNSGGSSSNSSSGSASGGRTEGATTSTSVGDSGSGNIFRDTKVNSSLTTPSSLSTSTIPITTEGVFKGVGHRLGGGGGDVGVRRASSYSSSDCNAHNSRLVTNSSLPASVSRAVSLKNTSTTTARSSLHGGEKEDDDFWDDVI